MNMISFRRHGSADLTDPETEAIVLQTLSGEVKLRTFRSREKFTVRKEYRVKFPFVSICAAVVLAAAALVVFRFFDSNLPDPVKAFQLSNSTLTFSEELARRNLEFLTAVGVRVSGSEAADVTTVQNVLKILQEIKDSDDNSDFNLEFTVQKPSGSFFLNERGGFTSAYQGISNIVAKLEPLNEDPANSSVLVNCHFDTKPGTPGASDDMISCAVALEVIRSLYLYKPEGEKADVLFRNSIVFLFNGAEEMGLQGAHGFVQGDGTGHDWAENVKCFINLEAAGSGGKEILFQSGPGSGWITRVYANAVPHPYASVVAEEMFQSGLIPSDTDFRIFRDYKRIPGLDMAFIKNGWIYHTRWDTAAEIPPGSIQHMGDNVLALVQDLGTMDLENLADLSDSKMVFFDVLGLFIITYSNVIGIIANLAVAAVFITLVLIEIKVKKSKTKVGTVMFLLLSAILAWGSSVGVGALLGLFLNGIGYYKPFFSYPFMAMVMFGLPAIFMQALVFSYAWKGSQRKSWLASKFTMAVGVLGIAFVTRGTYIIMITLLFASIAWIPRRIIYSRLKKNADKYVLYSDLVIGELVPLVMSLSIVQVDMFVPLVGRTGPGVSPNIMIGIMMASSVAVLAFHGLGSYLVSLKRIHLILGLILTFFLLNCVLAVGFIGKIPYQTKTPMRLRVSNTERIWYNSDMSVNGTDSGYWFWPVDQQTAYYFPEFAKSVPELQEFSEIPANSNDCSNLFCDQPLHWPTGKSTQSTLWVPKATGLPSTLTDSVHMQVTKKLNSAGVRTLSVSFQGPAQCTISLSPGPDFNIKDWSLDSPAKELNDLTYKSSPVYFLYLGKGYGAPSFNLTLTLEPVSKKPVSDRTLLKIMYTGYFMSVPKKLLPHDIEFGEFLTQFPTWTNLMSWTTVLKQYTITV